MEQDSVDQTPLARQSINSIKALTETRSTNRNQWPGLAWVFWKTFYYHQTPNGKGVATFMPAFRCQSNLLLRQRLHDENV